MLSGKSISTWVGNIPDLFKCWETGNSISKNKMALFINIITRLYTFLKNYPDSIGIFYKLDNQLLYDNGAFDLSIFNQIDAPRSLKEEILAIYNNARCLKLSLD